MRAAVPDLALTTDIIVGFPGETEEDFLETLEVVEEVRYDGAFTFVFSPRRGTEAATMSDQVPDEVKRERIERLIDVVQRISRERNEERVGGMEEVLVEGPAARIPVSCAGARGATRRSTSTEPRRPAISSRCASRGPRRRRRWTSPRSGVVTLF